jgi:hypothetical protein
LQTYQAKIKTWQIKTIKIILHPQKKRDEITQIHHSDYTTEFLQAKKVFGQKDE